MDFTIESVIKCFINNSRVRIGLLNDRFHRINGTINENFSRN